MAFKKILCVLCGCGGDEAAVASAFSVARRFEAHVQGLFVSGDPRDAVPMLGEGVSGSLVQQVMDIARKEGAEHATHARACFDAGRVAAGAVPATEGPGPGGVTTSWTEQVGRPEDTVIAFARVADLVVFPHITTTEESQGILMFEAALMAGGKPILVAPPTAPHSIGSHPAVAWNGSIEAARTVGLSMTLLAAADDVHILTAGTGKTATAHGDRLAALLAWHGIHSTPYAVTVGHEPVGAALLRSAAEVGSDLLVMGGYGHSRLREMILGGVTRHVLNQATIPVLMGH
ncbi:universal stress protein [Rhodospirillum centenum]|uniref:Universal stress protein family n=1 Tax=Rhodospirillum centenum (strain ATCC 51521 / SW) TaxID=414684 RepID=B6ITQ1_RHOCS|nr:universal stress protein [Rhodospirillum centenum]ACI99352.1 universal stress protein family [Rhodospirillum centenum SW]